MNLSQALEIHSLRFYFAMKNENRWISHYCHFTVKTLHTLIRVRHLLFTSRLNPSGMQSVSKHNPNLNFANCTYLHHALGINRWLSIKPSRAFFFLSFLYTTNQPFWLFLLKGFSHVVFNLSCGNVSLFLMNNSIPHSSFLTALMNISWCMKSTSTNRPD